MDEIRGELVETLSLARRFLNQRSELGESEFRFTSGCPSSEGHVAADLQTFAGSIAQCQECRLSGGRTQVVFGSGNPEADLMFVGEGPGREEDISGLPFVGAAGQLLTRIIEAAGLRREDVYIANVVKCRPPENRNPHPDEVAACHPHLLRQIELVGPKLICALGKVAAQSLLGTDEPIGKLRGRLHLFKGIRVIATYHPAALLRNASLKRPTWEDFKLLRKELDGVRL